MGSESMQRDGAIFLRGTFGGKLTGIFRDMCRTNRTASSNPFRSASKSLHIRAFPDPTEESCEKPGNVRALASGRYRMSNERGRAASLTRPRFEAFSPGRVGEVRIQTLRSGELNWIDRLSTGLGLGIRISSGAPFFQMLIE
jgi:hypothetical protein